MRSAPFSGCQRKRNARAVAPVESRGKGPEGGGRGHLSWDSREERLPSLRNPVIRPTWPVASPLDWGLLLWFFGVGGV